MHEARRAQGRVRLDGAAAFAAKAARCRRPGPSGEPEAPYGASKHTVEHYLYIWKLLHGLDYTVLRYPNVFGLRQNPHGEAGVNAIFIGLMLEGAPAHLRRRRSGPRLLFIDDVVAANVLALEKGGGC